LDDKAFLIQLRNLDLEEKAFLFYLRNLVLD